MKQILKKLWPYIRIALSVALLWLATRNIDWQALRDTKISIHPLWFGLALIMLILTNLLAVLRWGWLMRSVKLYRPAWDYIALYFTGGLINQGLPSTIGGDSYRAVQGSRSVQSLHSVNNSETLHEALHHSLDLNHAPPRLRLSFFSVALDRGLGLVGNNILGALGLILGGAMLGPWGETLGWWILGAMLGGAALAATLLKAKGSRRLIEQILHKLGMPQAMAALNVALGWKTVCVQLAISVMTHLLALTSFWCCLMAFGVNAPLSALMIGMPALGLLMMLPISISGWGLREATLSATLALWQIDSGITVLASVSFGIVTLITYLPGAITLLKRPRAGSTQQAKNASKHH
ncbi:lysylphosphatidylglycerol synthase transmembrane domain-containing protein [Zwartia sp.]|uniref:lysylphosphatidylglycerol synthase transmembrane domain-containing protein n=1 Tax=Zwartia sp. TaxID=2978004 RepID=UPI0027164153|nr:lysylphosphatidylglycerol synthase transmembrane domain-containing protein [Zwartia sp.]MDO9025807.1 lysylphosphatidylglycerol synthase transmembrane domain-containing protein [Zwartia sp.]